MQMNGELGETGVVSHGTQGTAAPVLPGWVKSTWQMGETNGRFNFCAARRDDYLELIADQPPAPDDLFALDEDLGGDIQVTPFPEGAGVGFFRFLPRDTLAGATAEERLRRFVEALAGSALPGAVWADGTLTLSPVRARPHAVAAEPVVEAPSAADIVQPDQADSVEAEGEEDPLLPVYNAVEEGRFGHAERHLRTILGATSPHGCQMLNLLSAARRAERRLRRYPRDASAHLEHAWALYLLGAPVSASRHAEAALRIDPERSCAHALTGMAAWERGDSASAKAAYERASTRRGAQGDIHVRLLGAVLDGEPLAAALERLSAESRCGYESQSAA